MNAVLQSNPDHAATLDVTRIRDDFPILGQTAASGQPLVYLDNAASTQRPAAVIDAMDDCYRRYYANVHRGIHTLSEAATEAYEQARGTVAGFVNAATPREIVFTAGTTAAINTVARSWGDANLAAGDVVLLPITEHHANIVPWHQLASRTGCQVRFIDFDEDHWIDSAAVAEAMRTDRPKLFAFAAASNTFGSEVPVADWTRIAHDAGATVLVDAAQAAPHHVVDVEAWDCDFLVFSGHKVCGPTGIGVLYGRETLLDAMPPFLGGGGMINTVTREGFTAHVLPEKFEAGTPPIVEAIGLGAALGYLQNIGLNRIHAHERRLNARVDAGLRAIEGVRVIGPSVDRKGGITSFVMDRVHAHDIAQTLDGAGIAIRAGHHCTMPLHAQLGIAASARASCYLYNTESEVDHLIESVEAIGKRFAKTGRRRRPRR